MSDPEKDILPLGEVGSQAQRNPAEGSTFDALVTSIQSASEQLAARAAKAVNLSLTVRNWLIGYYIAQYELNGADRATYGEQLLPKLAGRLKDLGISTCTKRSLYKYLRFYQVYPSIVRSPTAQFIDALSYTHIEQIVAVDSEEKRDFYATQCITGAWSVRELKRQIGSLLHERNELSTDTQSWTNSPRPPLKLSQRRSRSATRTSSNSSA